LLDTVRAHYEKMGWAEVEKVTANIIKKSLGKDYTVIQGVSKSPYSPDIIVKNNNIPSIPFIAEVKQWISKRIPITSKTGNAFKSTFNSGAFGDADTKAYNDAKKIVDYIFGTDNVSLLEKEYERLFNKKPSNITKQAKNIKLTSDEARRFAIEYGATIGKDNELVGGRRKVLEGGNFPVSIDFAVALNESKRYPQDVIVIADTVFDYFNGYTQFDTFAEALGEDYNPDDLFIWTVDVQINNGYLTNRGYLNFNPKYEEKLIDYIKNSKHNLSDISKKSVDEVISIKAAAVYSKSLEDNLNSYKGISNIDLVSKYISDNNIKMEIVFPMNYPFIGPSIKINTPFKHDCIDENGNFNVFNDCWSPAYSLGAIILMIKSYLSEDICEFNRQKWRTEIYKSELIIKYHRRSDY
jgi:ubiquitin-protein ligase